MFLAKGHRAMLGVARVTTTFLLSLREILVVETHKGDVVGSDVEEHQFVVEEGVLCEFVWQVEN